MAHIEVTVMPARRLTIRDGGCLCGTEDEPLPVLVQPVPPRNAIQTLEQALAYAASGYNASLGRMRSASNEEARKRWRSAAMAYVSVHTAIKNALAGGIAQGLVTVDRAKSMLAWADKVADAAARRKKPPKPPPDVAAATGDPFKAKRSSLAIPIAFGVGTLILLTLLER